MAFLAESEADSKAVVKPVRRRMMSPGCRVMLDSWAISLNMFKVMP